MIAMTQNEKQAIKFYMECVLSDHLDSANCLNKTSLAEEVIEIYGLPETVEEIVFELATDLQSEFVRKGIINE